MPFILHNIDLAPPTPEEERLIEGVLADCDGDPRTAILALVRIAKLLGANLDRLPKSKAGLD